MNSTVARGLNGTLSVAIKISTCPRDQPGICPWDYNLFMVFRDIYGLSIASLVTLVILADSAMKRQYKLDIIPFVGSTVIMRIVSMTHGYIRMQMKEKIDTPVYVCYSLVTGSISITNIVFMYTIYLSFDSFRRLFGWRFITVRLWTAGVTLLMAVLISLHHIYGTRVCPLACCFTRFSPRVQEYGDVVDMALHAFAMLANIAVIKHKHTTKAAYVVPWTLLIYNFYNTIYMGYMSLDLDEKMSPEYRLAMTIVASLCRGEIISTLFCLFMVIFDKRFRAFFVTRYQKMVGHESQELEENLIAQSEVASTAE